MADGYARVNGCMRMHGMEVATAARYRVPVLFVVSNNGALGNVYLRARKDNAGARPLRPRRGHPARLPDARQPLQHDGGGIRPRPPRLTLEAIMAQLPEQSRGKSLSRSATE